MRRALTASFWLAATPALAGGHLDVDDAGTLDPGQCQYELWGTRVGDARTTLWHVGPACRVGPIELGLNIDRAVGPDEKVDLLGPQVKWTFLGRAPEARWSAALSVSATFDVSRSGGRAGGQFVLPVTWRATDSLMVHANLGADWLPGPGTRTGRGGLGFEWALTPGVSLLAERNRSFGLWTSRVGARFSITPLISIDVTTARTGPEGLRSVTIGFNHEFSW